MLSMQIQKNYPEPLFSIRVLLLGPLFSLGWCDKYIKSCDTAVALSWTSSLKAGAGLQDKLQCDPLDHSRNLQKMLWTSVCLEVLPSLLHGWPQSSVLSLATFTYFICPCHPSVCPAPRQHGDPWPSLLRRTLTLPDSRTLGTCRRLGFRLSPGFPYWWALQQQKNMHAYGQQKESSLRRGPVSTACTAQAGRGSAAQGAGCVWEFHLLSMRLAVPLSIRMPLSTKLLNASLTTAGTRILIKSFLGGTAVCPLLPIETSGALEIQICSHHAKMQWLWHCLSSTESWKSSIPWAWDCISIAGLQYHPYPLESVLHGLLTVPLPWLHTNHLPDKQQPNLTLLLVTWEIKPTRVYVCFIVPWCSDRD